ncbi:F-box/FBD/LRR-repeat protein At1g13570-like [Bidens hawaiensis]|uniref:F-box/FBD/LRR-repeat protein At1g13570-like n=1 Tax=Bidens hawaiensis TaxID=980011 RepID=UPI004049129C
MVRISKLPSGIIETILCLLPIQEAARTSILSKEWRYHWIKIPKLEFDEETFQVSTDGDEPSIWEQTFDETSERKEMTKRCKLFFAIYQVLLMHEGPVNEFTLCMQADNSCIEVDQIILHLSKKNTVKVLYLHLYGGPKSYRLPLSFFSLHQLTDLYLIGCVLDHQPSSNVFSSLTTLYLLEINTCGKVLLSLLSSCPILKRLTIMSDNGTIDESGDFTIVDLMECVPNFEYLCAVFSIFTCFLPLPKEPTTRLVHLKYLCMELVWLRHKYAIPFLVLLIKSFPNMEKLKLELSIDELFDESETGSSTLEDYSDAMLEHLNELEILYFSNGENELLVVKLILAKLHVLKNVRIRLWDRIREDAKLDISNVLLSFPCASPAVKIIVS